MKQLAGAALLMLAACAGSPETPASGEVRSFSTQLGMTAYDSGDFPRAFVLLQEQASTGDPLAQVYLGYMYANGDGVPVDNGKALRLFETAAEQGSAEAMNAIGYKYDYGIGVAPDLNAALKWYCLATAKGNERAYNNLAVLYNKGEKLPRDVPLARRLWKQAAALGSVKSMNNLALSYLDDASNGTDAERAEGMQWLVLAAIRGYPRATQAAEASAVTQTLPSVPEESLPDPLPFEENFDIPVCRPAA